MNRKLILPLITLCCMMAWSCKAPVAEKVSVHGEIKDLGTSTLCISYYNQENILAFDTVSSSRSGKFDFKVESYDEITPVTIYFSEKKCWTTLFAKPGDHVTMKGDIQLVDLLNISGGKVNDDLSRYKKQIKRLYLNRLAILDGQFTTSDEKDEHLAEINLLLKRTAKEYIKDNPSSIASVVLIQDFFYQDYDPSTKALLDLLQEDAKDFHLTTRIREGIQSW